jgi:hypothetical protein
MHDNRVTRMEYVDAGEFRHHARKRKKAESQKRRAARKRQRQARRTSRR